MKIKSTWFSKEIEISIDEYTYIMNGTDINHDIQDFISKITVGNKFHLREGKPNDRSETRQGEDRETR
jgi:hypothetical protein